MSLDGPPVILRVASVPAAHTYVAHLRLDTVGIELLPDPLPPGAPPGRWWPPVMLDAEWISRHAESFDVLHIHFGTESFSMRALSSALEALSDASRPLVYTVHDLENPQLADQGHHQEQLELLITHASELITLTPGAANEIAQRWDRASTVIPHPAMLGDGWGIPGPAVETPLRRFTPPPPFTVGVHLRDLRPSIDGPGVVGGLLGAVARLSGEGIEVCARINLFESVRDAAGADRVRAAAAAAPQVTLVEQSRASDAALVANLSELDVSLLPYRHGTHSGWAELCWDLALPMVGADIGYIGEQHQEPGWFSVCDPTDPAALARVLGSLARASSAPPSLRAGTPREPVVAARRVQRRQLARQIADSHRTVYLRALGR